MILLHMLGTGEQYKDKDGTSCWTLNRTSTKFLCLINSSTLQIQISLIILSQHQQVPSAQTIACCWTQFMYHWTCYGSTSLLPDLEFKVGVFFNLFKIDKLIFLYYNADVTFYNVNKKIYHYFNSHKHHVNIFQ